MSEAHCAGVRCKVSHGACINIAAPQLVQSTQHALVTKGYVCDNIELISMSLSVPYS